MRIGRQPDRGLWRARCEDDSHGGFGRRPGETGWSKGQHRAPGRPYGWTAPKIRSPKAADRWTWLIIAAHTQLRPARHLIDDLRHPWEKLAAPGRSSRGSFGTGVLLVEHTSSRRGCV